jgi:hypothetical protein
VTNRNEGGDAGERRGGDAVGQRHNTNERTKKILPARDANESMGKIENYNF